MSDSSQQCPGSWRLISGNGVRACGRPSSGCHSQTYIVQRRYNKVCGQVVDYQVGSPCAFHDRHSDLIDQNYVDGVSVTYGRPRKHIWKFAASITETLSTTYLQQSCPCTVAGTGLQTPQPPSFVGNNSYCESGNPLNAHENTGILRYTDDSLWMVGSAKANAATMLIILLLSLVSSFLMKQVTILKYASVDMRAQTMMTHQSECWIFTFSDSNDLFILRLTLSCRYK